MTKETFELQRKEVRKHNATAGYISMPLEDVGKEYLVMTLQDLEFLLGRKYNDKTN